MSHIIALATLLLASGSPTGARCNPISGWETVVAKKEVRWIIIGEMHGTSETPEIFSDAVCLTAVSRGPVIVGLELPSTDQTIVDQFINSDGGETARARLLKALLWQLRGSVSSEAFLRLFERLRQLHSQGSVKRVVAFQDNVSPYDPSGGQGPYEERLASIVRNAAEPGATIIVLVGNIHARKSQVNFGRPFMPMASLLPADETVTLDAVGNGGMAWNCQRDGCGPHITQLGPKPAERGVALVNELGGPFDGLLNLGVPTTASPPRLAGPSTR